MKRKRILTGMRTTGRLHLGHYVGALRNWLQLQAQYDCYFLLADVQALTTHFDRVAGLEDSGRQVVIDWLSVGLNSEKTSFVLQSAVPEYYELTTYLSFFTDKGELELNPTIKDEIANLGSQKINVGFFTYPVSQASDILLLSPIPPQEGDELLVPVGLYFVMKVLMVILLSILLHRKRPGIYIISLPLCLGLNFCHSG